MSMLIAGVILWSAAHLLKAAAPALRSRIEQRLGPGPYRGLFSLIIVGSLLLIVFGWKATMPRPLYTAPMSGGPIIAALVLAGLVLFFSSQFNGNIKRYVRHPQMAGTLLWGIAHLLVNGDSRSVTLFGGFAAWALLEIFLINRRDGAWVKPGPAAFRNDALPLVVGSAAFAALTYFHQALFGVAVL